MTEQVSYIPTRIKNASVGGHVAGAVDIYDDDLEKEQSEINLESVADRKDLKERVADLENRATLVVEGSEITLENDSDNIVPAQPGDDPKIPTVNAVANFVG